MSHYVYYCELPWECKILPTGDDCATCQNLDFAERVADVYRPHRRAVVQSCFTEKVELGFSLFPRVLLSARLGCPEARAWVRRKKRLESNTFLTRLHWARRPRALDARQAGLARGWAVFGERWSTCSPTG